MRTPFLDPEKISDHGMEFSQAYVSTLANIVRHVTASHSTQPLNTDKAAWAIVREVLTPTEIVDEKGQGHKPLLPLQLGRECVYSMEARMREFGVEEFNVTKALTCDFNLMVI